LTNDSSTSDRSPTDPVTRYATALRTMVIIAAVIENQAYLASDELFVVFDVMECILARQV
jgi:hypothetical protein